MSRNPNLVQLHQLSGPALQHRLLVELNDLFEEIEDGTVKDNTFTGCIALGQGSLPPLNEEQSKQIRESLLREPVSRNHPEKASVPILNSVFNLIRGLWRSHDSKGHPAQDGVKSDSALLDQFGRIKNNGAALNGEGENSPAGNPGILETDVKRFFAAQPEDFTWVMPYTWDIANRLNAVKKSETDGDLALFLERRRKLNVRRPKATRFEQSAQRYAANISELFCGDQGNIIDEKSLETFIRELVTTLLERTKSYWPTNPMLAIFDGLVVTVMRPLLHKHETAYFESDIATETGMIVSGNIAGKTEKLLTTPKWNEKSHRLVTRFIRKAFRAQVWSFFLDRYAPYNREYCKSPHLNPATLNNVGLLVKNFGNPVHLNKVMELFQPTSQAEELVQRVVEHFRSDSFIDH